MIKRILFICYANTCRTPAAEKLAEFYARKYNIKELVFDSAGWHIAFDYAQPETIEYLKLKGINMNNFKPKAITRVIIEKQDFIIGMERYQLTKIKNKFKPLKESLKGKLYTLKEFNGADKKNLNIPDPYKKVKEKYFEILEIVERNVEMLVKKVKYINETA
ncbi:MAG: arsenate reductase/protein-tyrosine-phosphatase family protein [Promethearchaeota archaeon]|jgi:protein-tyrosine-phosphatase